MHEMGAMYQAYLENPGTFIESYKPIGGEIAEMFAGFAEDGITPEMILEIANERAAVKERIAVFQSTLAAMRDEEFAKIQSLRHVPPRSVQIADKYGQANRDTKFEGEKPYEGQSLDFYKHDTWRLEQELRQRAVTAEYEKRRRRGTESPEV